MKIMFAMIVRELKANAKVWLIWSVIIILFNVAGVMKFEGIAAGDPDSIRKLTDSFPKVALAVMGIADLDMSAFSGYYAVLEFYTGIMAAVYAVALARNAVSREITDGTYEFLFVRPVSRTVILTSKFVAGLIDGIAFVAINAVSSLLCVQMLGNVSGLSGDAAATVIWHFTVWLCAVMLVFGAIGACSAAVCKQPERGSAVGNAAVVVAYCAGVVYDMFADYDAAVVARVFSPFRYATPSDVIDGKVPVLYMVLAGLIVVIGVVITYRVFKTCDLAVR